MHIRSPFGRPFATTAALALRPLVAVAFPDRTIERGQVIRASGIRLD